MAFGRPSLRDDQRAEAYAEWLRKRHPLAIASLVLGVFSLIEFGVLIVFGVAGIVLGVMALVQLRGGTPAGKTHGHALAWAGIVTSVASFVLAMWVYGILP
jgi:hypothetical protein